MSIPGFDKAQWKYENMSPPEAPDCGCEEADDPDHDAQQCLDDQREAAAEAKADEMWAQAREDEMWAQERRGW